MSTATVLCGILLVAGCGSDGGGGGTTTTSGTDTAAGTDAGSLDDGGGSADGATGGVGNGDTATGNTDGGTANTTDAGGGAGEDATGGSSDSGSAAKYTTCVAVGTCTALACTDNKPGCQDVCFDAATAEAKAKASAMFNCIQTKCVQGECKTSKDPNCVDQCNSKHCLPEFVACLDSGVAGSDKCGDGIGCFDECDLAKTEGIGCYGKCYDKLSKTAQGKLHDVGKCAAANPKEEFDKVCGAELFGCVLDGKSGTDGCHTIFKCLQDCEKAGKKDETCQFECLGKVTEKAQQTYVKMAGCFTGDKATQTDCKSLFKQCIEPAGKKTCAQVWDCVAKCEGGQQSPVCPFICLKDGDDAAFDKYYAFSTCNAGSTDDGLSQKCYDAIIGCAVPAGQGDCKALTQCTEACNKTKQGQKDADIACIFECAPKVSQAAFDTLWTAATCSDKCKKDCKDQSDSCSGECIQKNCGKEVAECGFK